MKFNDLQIGNFFTTYEHGVMFVGVKVGTDTAVNLHSGVVATIHFNRRIEAGKVTQIDIERATLARQNDEIVLAHPTENGRWLLHRFVIVSTELMNTENLTFPTKTGEDGNFRSEVDIILNQLTRNLTLAVNWAESAKECLKVT